MHVDGVACSTGWGSLRRLPQQERNRLPQASFTISKATVRWRPPPQLQADQAIQVAQPAGRRWCVTTRDVAPTSGPCSGNNHAVVGCFQTMLLEPLPLTLKGIHPWSRPAPAGKPRLSRAAATAWQAAAACRPASWRQRHTPPLAAGGPMRRFYRVLTSVSSTCASCQRPQALFCGERQPMWARAVLLAALLLLSDHGE